MADIKLFKTTGMVTELPAKTVMLERELQTLIERNMQQFFGVTFLQSEYVIAEGRMDSLGIDENNCPVIFEYKRSISESVINQGLYYLDWLMDHQAEFRFLVMKVCEPARADQIDWTSPSVICVANDFTKYDVHAVNQMQRNIRLVRYRKFGEDLFLFENVNVPNITSAPNGKSIPAVKKDQGQEITTPIPKTGSDKSFMERLDSATQEQRDLYLSIRDYILSLGDDIAVTQLKLYVAFKKFRNFATIDMTARSINISLSLNPDDYKERLKKDFIRDMRNIGHWGTGDLQVNIRSAEDFEKAKDIILKAYEVN